MQLPSGDYKTIGKLPVALGGLAKTREGKLYGLGQDGNLYLVDGKDASTHLIGPAGIMIWIPADVLHTAPSGMAADSKGILYAYGSDTKLYSLDPASGKATFILLLKFDGCSGIAFDENDKLCYLSYIRSSDFDRLDLSSKTVEHLGEIGSNLGVSNLGINAFSYVNHALYALGWPNRIRQIYLISIVEGKGKSAVVGSWRPPDLGAMFFVASSYKKYD